MSGKKEATGGQMYKSFNKDEGRTGRDRKPNDKKKIKKKSSPDYCESTASRDSQKASGNF